MATYGLTAAQLAEVKAIARRAGISAAGEDAWLQAQLARHEEYIRMLCAIGRTPENVTLGYGIGGTKTVRPL